MRTQCHGPFLCVRRATLDDGTDVILHRYIDLEMSWVFDAVRGIEVRTAVSA